MRTPTSPTMANLQAAFAGESMAHIKYLHFARIARAHGDLETAALFEETAKQEVQHALGHADLLFPPASLDPRKALQLAIEGETHEYTEMYPAFHHAAVQEGNSQAAGEFAEQIAESQQHAAEFATLLAKAAKRFAALAKVEERHAQQYQRRLQAAG
ncbi:MAG: rubrerythrin [Deltaproteobacteria bacterium]|nr:rubrerythrin [Deltaproteobacteria bacterium]